MKAKYWSRIAVVVCAGLIAAAFAFRFLRIEDGHVLLRSLEGDASEILSKPYFHLGTFAITPVSLTKALVYLLLLGFVARALSVFLERQVPSRTKLDIGQRYSIRRVTQYVLYFDFQLRIWTATKFHVRPILLSNLYFAIFRAFRENGIEIPFPQRDMHLRTADVPLPVQQLPPQ